MLAIGLGMNMHVSVNLSCFIPEQNSVHAFWTEGTLERVYALHVSLLSCTNVFSF